MTKTEVPQLIHKADIPTMQKHRTQKRRKQNIRMLYASLCVAGVLFVLLLVWMIFALYFREKYRPGTFVNGVKIAGMTQQEAEQAILCSTPDASLTFLVRDEKPVVLDGSAYDSRYRKPEGAMPDTGSSLYWFAGLFRQTEYAVSLAHLWSEDALKDTVRAYPWGNIPPTDAAIVQAADGSYVIEPEQPGNQVNAVRLANYAAKILKNGDLTIDLEKADCYAKPKITSADLQEPLKAYQALSGMTVTYDFDDRQEILDTETLFTFVRLDERGNILVDPDAVRAWVEDKLVPYDTYVPGYTRTFRSTLQGTVQVPLGEHGIYGWKTDVDATVNALTELIRERKSITTEPVYKQKGFVRAADDIGDTYIELDITNQHAWAYQNGVCVWNSDCVTGTQTVESRRTPPGVYQLWHKETDRTLGTMATHGYECFVHYWMYFTDISIGFHDLSRSAYGGTIYMYNGSHGCVNLPLSKAKELYQVSEIGESVIVIP